MTTTRYARNHQRALILAAEYRSLAASGRIAEAEGVERTIDCLVGYRDSAAPYWFQWPDDVASAASVASIRSVRHTSGD